jgi:hypothetical protein
LDLEHLRDGNPPLRWSAFGERPEGKILREVTVTILTIHVAEAENERTFSVRRHVVGDRGGWAKKD